MTFEAHWGADPDSPVRARMSDGLRRRIELEEMQEARQAARVEREAQSRAAYRFEQAEAAAVEQYRVENCVDLLTARREAPIGHTRAEFVASRWAVAEWQDVRERAEYERQVRAALSKAGLLDTSAVDLPMPGEIAIERAVAAYPEEPASRQARRELGLPRTSTLSESDAVRVGRGLRGRGIRERTREWLRGGPTADEVMAGQLREHPVEALQAEIVEDDAS